MSPLNRWMIRGGDGCVANPGELSTYFVELHDLAHTADTDPALLDDLTFRCFALGMPIAVLADVSHCDDITVLDRIASRQLRSCRN